MAHARFGTTLTIVAMDVIAAAAIDGAVGGVAGIDTAAGIIAGTAIAAVTATDASASAAGMAELVDAILFGWLGCGWNARFFLCFFVCFSLVLLLMTGLLFLRLIAIAAS